MALMKTCNVYDGSETVETVLWTNPSPNSAFGTTTIINSGSKKFTDYDLIKIYYKDYIGSSNDNLELSFKPIPVWQKNGSYLRTYIPLARSLNANSTNVFVYRLAWASLSSEYEFSISGTVSSNSTASTTTTMCVPIQITGIIFS